MNQMLENVWKKIVDNRKIVIKTLSVVVFGTIGAVIGSVVASAEDEQELINDMLEEIENEE